MNNTVISDSVYYLRVKTRDVSGFDAQLIRGTLLLQNNTQYYINEKTFLQHNKIYIIQ